MIDHCKDLGLVYTLISLSNSDLGLSVVDRNYINIVILLAAPFELLTSKKELIFSILKSVVSVLSINFDILFLLSKFSYLI